MTCHYPDPSGTAVGPGSSWTGPGFLAPERPDRPERTAMEGIVTDLGDEDRERAVELEGRGHGEAPACGAASGRYR